MKEPQPNIEKKPDYRVVQSTITKSTNKLSYGLRRPAGSMTTWNAKLNETVIRDIELTIRDCAHRCRALWSLLDDESDFGKVTLRLMEQLVRDYMGEPVLPSCEQETVDQEEINVPALWRSMKGLLADMIVEGCELSALDILRGIVRTQGENDLSLIHQAQMIL